MTYDRLFMTAALVVLLLIFVAAMLYVRRRGRYLPRIGRNTQ